MDRIDIFHLRTHFPKYNIVAVKEGEKHVDFKEEHTGLQEELDIHVQALHKDMVQTAQADQQEVLTCATAPGVTFKSVGELAAHYKSDWHVWNLKLKASHSPPMPREEFEQLLKDGDLSGMLAEDAEGGPEEEIKPLKGSNRVKFITSDSQMIEIWKNVIVANPKERSPLADLIGELEDLHEKKRWLILMSSGGRFAGAAFDENNCTRHKTFVRYTVRKKQGGSQSTKDNKSGTSAPKSAGATMRRYNEKRFREQILEVLTDWEEEVKNAHYIFLCAPGANWNYFFVGLKGLKRGDPRIRSVPFSAHRPSLVEVKRIHFILSSAEISKYEETEPIPSTSQQTQRATQPTTQEEQPAQEEEHLPEPPQEDQEDKIAKAITENDLEGLINIFQSEYEIPIPNDVNSIKTPVYLCVELNNTHILKFLLELDTGDLDTPTLGWHHRTPLHRAAVDGNTEVVKLLLDANANPGMKDATGQTPYLLANPTLREYLRRYAAEHLEMWEWEKVGITPLTKEMEEAKKSKMAEKKKRKKMQAKINKNEKKEKEQQEALKNKIEQEKKEKEKLLNTIAMERAAKLANMSEREKRALAAETRLSNKQGLCAFCNAPLTMVPFHRLDYKYCTVECVSKHMQILGEL